MASRKKTAQASEGDQTAYQKVVGTARLEDILLVSSSFSIDPEYYAASEKTHHIHVQQEFSTFEDQAATACEFSVTAKADEKDILLIKAKFVVSYSQLQGQAGPAVEAFVKQVGVFAAYPYFRSFVSQLSWMASAQLPIAPILRLSQPGATGAPRPSD